MSYNLLFCCRNYPNRFGHWGAIWVSSCAFPHFLTCYLLCEYWLTLAMHFCIYKVNEWKLCPLCTAVFFTEHSDPWHPLQGSNGDLNTQLEEQSGDEMTHWLCRTHNGHQIYMSLSYSTWNAHFCHLSDRQVDKTVSDLWQYLKLRPKLRSLLKNSRVHRTKQ